MEKIASMVIMFALLPVLLLQFSRLVGAADISLFSNGGCNQPGQACTNIPPAVICCPTVNLGFASIYITSAFDNTMGKFFTRGSTGDCSNFAGTGAPGNTVCSKSPPNKPLYTGALWAIEISRRRSLLDLDFMTSVSTKFMEPNAVVFTEDGTIQWTLPTSEANELYSQMMNVADDEKVDWLKSKGATYREL